jgi:hypothetical protein
MNYVKISVEKVPGRGEGRIHGFFVFWSQQSRWGLPSHNSQDTHAPPHPNPQVVRLLTVPVTTQLFCVCVFLLGSPAFHKKSLWMLPQAPSINCFVVSVRRFIDWQEQTLLVASGGSNLEMKVCSRQSRRSATDCLFWPRSSHHFFPLFQSKVYISAKQGMLGRGEGPTKHGQNAIIM